jgi:hypothetical protein
MVHQRAIRSAAPTLLDVIAAVGEITTHDGEVVAVVARMLRSGRVRLTRRAPSRPRGLARTSRDT